ncbi:hypothetical protein Aph01nite_00760 [Acrocarpospora phusangensis]|uniref:Lipoprotein n=1 Tax=Acrocarpospora phusangensis TaxID=1070424 RepID=A0A919UHP7_9ACTN|nr:hypothetical protein [Acrocarpospora phusangensis]GIH21766.1 hypothetical protein Aph01nite_00760 [Acrocarpospora phusangensis]
MRTLGRLAALTLAGCLLTACGGGTGTEQAAARDDGVATLVTQSPVKDDGAAEPTPSKKPDAESKRPQLRLDSTEEEIAELRRAYAACLGEHGMPQGDGEVTAAMTKAIDKARKACEDKMPLLPPEMDPDQNPHYADAVRKQVKCMKEHGFDVSITPATGSNPNAIGWTYNSVPGPGVDIGKIQDDCRAAGFGGGAALRPGPA